MTSSPRAFFFGLAGKERSRQSNKALGGILAFSAGAINAGGFLAVGQYTSHMTGIISAIADDLVLGNTTLVIAGVLAFLSFVAGAASTAIFINWARRQQLNSEYATSIALEALLLLLFGLLGANLNRFVELLIPTTVILLTYIMGLQNAIMTKISKAEIRTTHMTGVVTDLGIELGRMLYWNRHKTNDLFGRVAADREKLKIHALILVLFVAGAILGAISFKAIGFLTTIPLSIVLLLIAAPPILLDLKNLK